MTWRVTPRIIISLASVALLTFSPALKAQGRSSWRLSTAVDAQGIRHWGSNYPGRAPWTEDAIKTVLPKYPYEARARGYAGSGVFRLTLETTGSVSKVTVVKSTGVAGLDNNATDAFRQWRWKPGGGKK